MGETWPADWLGAANAVRALDETNVTPDVLREVMAGQNVRDDNANILARWMHEFGEILYFDEDEKLGDEVVLKPRWISGYIYNVLDDKIIDELGIFTRDHMRNLWTELDPDMRDYCLSLMEQFDLILQDVRQQKH